MRFIKEKKLDLQRCYAAGSLHHEGQLCPIFATEGQGACLLFAGEGFVEKRTVWEKPGGTMSLVEIPGRDGEFLAVQNFFPTFQSENATIVWGRPDGQGGYHVQTILQLPYVHRFDILTRGGKYYFLASTLCSSKRDRDDWSDPGKIYVAELLEDLNMPMSLEVIREGLVKNHGYSRIGWQGGDAGLVGSDEGAFLVIPPEKPSAPWQVDTWLTEPVSDMAAIDLDGDGELELAVISPFHGDAFSLYKKQNGAYRLWYRYPVREDFYHVVKACHLRGVPTILGGCRRGEKELFMLQWNPQTQAIQATVIDRGGGPSNVEVIHEDEHDVIICASRESGEGVLYYVK